MKLPTLKIAALALATFCMAAPASAQTPRSLTLGTASVGGVFFVYGQVWANIAADAIIVRDFGHQLAANVFVRHHKPGRPIQLFGDKASAMAWLDTQRHLIAS